ATRIRSLFRQLRLERNGFSYRRLIRRLFYFIAEICKRGKREFPAIHRRATNPHFSRPNEKCARSADPAASGSGLAAKSFATESCFPSSLRRLHFSSGLGRMKSAG